MPRAAIAAAACLGGLAAAALAALGLWMVASQTLDAARLPWRDAWRAGLAIAAVAVLAGVLPALLLGPPLVAALAPRRHAVLQGAAAGALLAAAAGGAALLLWRPSAGTAWLGAATLLVGACGGAAAVFLGRIGR